MFGISRCPCSLPAPHSIASHTLMWHVCQKPSIIIIIMAKIVAVNEHASICWGGSGRERGRGGGCKWVVSGLKGCHFKMAANIQCSRSKEGGGLSEEHRAPDRKTTISYKISQGPRLPLPLPLMPLPLLQLPPSTFLHKCIFRNACRVKFSFFFFGSAAVVFCTRFGRTANLMPLHSQCPAAALWISFPNA